MFRFLPLAFVTTTVAISSIPHHWTGLTFNSLRPANFKKNNNKTLPSPCKEEKTHNKLLSAPWCLKRRSSTSGHRERGKPASSWLSGCRRWPGRRQRANHAYRWGPNRPAWNLHGQSESVFLPSLRVSALLKLENKITICIWSDLTNYTCARIFVW